MSKVFLGGTCNGSKWRNIIIPRLKIDYFNPVVDDWNDDAYQRELKEREECDFCLYLITPKMKGVYSIAEAVDDSNKRPTKTLFAFILEDNQEKFDKDQLASLNKVGVMIENNGGTYFKKIDELIEYLNK